MATLGVLYLDNGTVKYFEYSDITITPITSSKSAYVSGPAITQTVIRQIGRWIGPIG